MRVDVKIAFQGGFGTIEGRTFFARWAGLVTKGWAFVVIAGVLLDPFTAAFDRNMLVKHNLLDSFGVSDLVLVGFAGGLTKGVL